MAAGHGQLNVAHALAAHAGESDLHTATVTHDTLVLDALVFTAGTFPVLNGTEDTFTKEAALLGFEGSVVNGLRVLNFTLGPTPDGFRAGHGDLHIIHEVNALESEQFAG